MYSYLSWMRSRCFGKRCAFDSGVCSGFGIKRPMSTSFPSGFRIKMPVSETGLPSGLRMKKPVSETGLLSGLRMKRSVSEPGFPSGLRMKRPVSEPGLQSGLRMTRPVSKTGLFVSNPGFSVSNLIFFVSNPMRCLIPEACLSCFLFSHNILVCSLISIEFEFTVYTHWCCNVVNQYLSATSYTCYSYQCFIPLNTLSVAICTQALLHRGCLLAFYYGCDYWDWCLDASIYCSGAGIYL
jgi:hypothetical protein